MAEKTGMGGSAALAWLALALALVPHGAAQGESPYLPWSNGPPADPAYFPVGVWLQDPARAGAFRDIGVNLFIGLWQGPTRAQLLELQGQEMPVFTAQNFAALTSPENHVIQGWRQHDEPDNAQPDGAGGFGPCIPVSELISVYQNFRANDTTRPVYLNFGQGVANDNWNGRGVCTGDTAYYPAAAAAADILSFDFYPVSHTDPAVQGKLELLALGVQRLVQWAGGKIVWNFIETTHINNPVHRPSVFEIRAEVWMSLIHGSMGIVYFVHEWEPSFREDAIFRYPEIVQGVAAINQEVAGLAPVLNSPSLEGSAQVSSGAPVAFMMKSYQDRDYLFAVSMRNEETTAVFTLGNGRRAEAVVLGEDRSLEVEEGMFRDDFLGYAVHLYRLDPVAPRPPTNLRIVKS